MDGIGVLVELAGLVVEIVDAVLPSDSKESVAKEGVSDLGSDGMLCNRCGAAFPRDAVHCDKCGPAPRVEPGVRPEF